jgi:hypothetical protein
MKARLSNPKGDGSLRSQRDDPILVQVAIQKVQKLYTDQDLALEPASLRAIVAVAALLRLAEKKRDEKAVFAGLGREDAAKAFLKAALAQFGPTHVPGQ